MHKTLCALALLFVVPGAALAVTGPTTTPPPPPPPPSVTQTSTLNQDQSQNQNQQQQQNQAQKQGQTQSSTATSNASAAATSNASANNSQNVNASPTFTSDTTINEKQVRQAPDVFVSSSNTTAPCVVAVNGGISFPGGGIGLGGGKKDKGCEMRSRVELIAKFNPRAARAYLCDHDADLIRAFKETGQDCYAPDVVVVPRPIPAIIAPPAPQVVVTVWLQPAPVLPYVDNPPHYKPRPHHRHLRHVAAPCLCVKTKRN